MPLKLPEDVDFSVTGKSPILTSKTFLETTCPVCGGKLESVRNRTLYWDTVELMRTCSRCGYAAKSDASKPARYHISRKVRR